MNICWKPIVVGSRDDELLDLTNSYKYSMDKEWDRATVTGQTRRVTPVMAGIIYSALMAYDTASNTYTNISTKEEFNILNDAAAAVDMAKERYRK